MVACMLIWTRKSNFSVTVSGFFSKSCEYALQAVLYLAQQQPGQPVHLQDISSALRIPHHFLSKIMQTLARDEIVVSHRGVNGGFELGRQASEIPLIEVVQAMEGKAPLDRCLLGFSRCNDEDPCPAHRDWKQAKEIVIRMLHQQTVGDLSSQLTSKLVHIASRRTNA